MTWQGESGRREAGAGRPPNHVGYVGCGGGLGFLLGGETEPSSHQMLGEGVSSPPVPPCPGPAGCSPQRVVRPQPLETATAQSSIYPQPRPLSPALASLPAEPLSLALLWTPASGTHKGLRAQLPSRDSLGQGRHPWETGLHSGVGGAPGAHPQLPWSGPDAPGP